MNRLSIILNAAVDMVMLAAVVAVCLFITKKNTY